MLQKLKQKIDVKTLYHHHGLSSCNHDDSTKACLVNLPRFRVGRSPTSTLVARGSVGDGHVATHVADVADDVADGGKENLVKQSI